MQSGEQVHDMNVIVIKGLRRFIHLLKEHADPPRVVVAAMILLQTLQYTKF